jgi:NAD(P)H dehydrogenase (quinone)
LPKRICDVTISADEPFLGKNQIMKKNVLIVYAHPEPASLTRQLVELSMQTLQEEGHEVVLSDLYAMNWKAVFDENDFPSRANPNRLSFVAESGHAYSNGLQTADVEAEQQKLLAADAVILQFPFWWFGMPAILKGWVDRVFAYGLAYGYKGEGNRYRYGDGGLKGKRGILSVTVGGPMADYLPRGINGPLDQLLFPITHGMLFFAGMDVLPTYAVYGTGSITAAGVSAVKAAWRSRLERLFEDAPILFRRQNGGDYPDSHVLANHIAVGQTGLLAHIAEESDTLEALTWSEDHHDADAAIDRHHDRPLPVGNGESPTGVR